MQRISVVSAVNSFSVLDLVRLTPLMQRSSGAPEVRIGLIDGFVVASHPELAGQRVQAIGQVASPACSVNDSFACVHGTFVAGILVARRSSAAPAICPGCTLLVRPIFSETNAGQSGVPSATPRELAQAIRDCVAEGAHVVNLSAALRGSTQDGDAELYGALSHAASRRVIVVAAAGNDGVIASSAITRHPWVIPVVAYSGTGRPLGLSNLGSSIGRGGLGAPGDRITSLGTHGKTVSFGGTSAATPFVTGAIALLRSEFPAASAERIRLAVLQSCARRRTSVVPPLLNAWGAYQALQS